MLFQDDSPLLLLRWKDEGPPEIEDLTKALAESLGHRAEELLPITTTNNSSDNDKQKTIILMIGIIASILYIYIYIERERYRERYAYI